MYKPSFYIAKALKALSSAHNRGEEKGSKFLTSVRNFMVNIKLIFSEIVQELQNYYFSIYLISISLKRSTRLLRAMPVRHWLSTSAAPLLVHRLHW